MKVRIDKTLSQYLFLHNLSGWHYSFRDTFKEYWSKTPTSLSQEERVAIKQWTKFNKEYFKKHNSFIVEKYLQGKLTKKETFFIKSVFDILDPRFEYHFSRQLSNMKKVKNYLEKQKLGHQIKRIFSFYGIKKKIDKVYLTLSKDANHSAGGMYLGAVVLEFGDWKLKGQNKPLINLLLHEITHPGNVNKFLSASVNITLPPNFPGTKLDYVNEVFHQCLIGNIEITSNKALSEIKEPYKTLYVDVKKAQPFVKKYLNKGKEVDKKLVGEVLDQLNSDNV